MSVHDAMTTDTEESFGFTRPPTALAARLGEHAQVSGYVRVKTDTFYEREVSPADESGVSLVAYGMDEEFFGGISGHGTAAHLRVARGDGTNTFTGVERVTGTLAGLTGSFVITDAGYYTEHGTAHGRWTAVAGSGTGELEGLRAEGEFSVAINAPGGPLSVYTLVYWFDRTRKLPLPES